MTTNKPLTERLLDAFEYYYRENAALRLILSDRRVSGWEQRLQQLMADRKMPDVVRSMFSEVRAALAEQADPADALQQLLKIFPPNKQVN